MKLKCVDNDNGGLALTIERIYNLEYVDEYEKYHVKNDNGEIKSFRKGRFEMVDYSSQKPQLGVMPRFLWNEQRITDIKEAIKRRTKAFEEIPVGWINEYNELLTNLNAIRGE